MRAQRNPKYPAEKGLGEYLKLSSFPDDEIVPFGVSREKLTVFPKRVAFKVDKARRRVILVWSLGPTLSHLLWQFHEIAPEFDDCELVYPGKRLYLQKEEYEYRSLGMTLGEWADKSFLVQELTQKDTRGKERDFAVVEYRTTKTVQETRFFHVTAAKNLHSIEQRGLLPSRSSVVESLGWSFPGNFYLQRAVYMFTSPLRAIRLAYTLAEQGQEDMIILQVHGSWVRDTRLLGYDQDAIYDDDTRSMMFGALDSDFPYWVTSAEDSTRSITYKGRISPKFLSQYALIRWTPEIVEDYRTGKEVLDSAFEFQGTEEAEKFDEAYYDEDGPIEEGYEIGPGLFSSP